MLGEGQNKMFSQFRLNLKPKILYVSKKCVNKKFKVIRILDIDDNLPGLFGHFNLNKRQSRGAVPSLSFKFIMDHIT